MDVKEFSSQYTTSIGDEKTQVLLEFVIVFSRFECALKATLKYLNKGGNSIQPNWDYFVKAIRPSFDIADKTKIEQSIQYILASPPKIQRFNSLADKIEWTDNQKVAELKPELCKLVDHIKTIRNNLFHGGKFAGIIYDSQGAREISRDEQLLIHSINILGFLVHFDDDVKTAFFEPI